MGMDQPDLDAALLKIPGVLRVRRHGLDVLRLLVDPLDAPLLTLVASMQGGFRLASGNVWVERAEEALAA